MVKVLVMRIAMSMYFNRDFENFTISSKEEKRTRVGNPFGLNEMSRAPGTNERLTYKPMFLGDLLKFVKKATTSNMPLVNGMSCHRVIPIPATVGVRVNMKPLSAAIRSLNIAYESLVTP
jgi:hypothetical protein